MNFSPTTHSPSPVYGIQSIQENRAASETNQQFSAVAFIPVVPPRAYQATRYPNYKYFKFAQWVDLVSDLTNVHNRSESDKAGEEAGILRISEKQGTRWQLLKKLEGTVVSVSDETFTAHLRENQSDVSFIEAEIDLSELPEQERPLAVDGASLVLTITYFWQGGTRKRESSIYFRHLPDWTAREAAQAEEQTRHITDDIQWE